jgi:S1-C subfamily serine protease
MTQELRDQVLESRKVQRGSSCITVVIPAGPADDLGIDAGDTVIFSGDVGDTSLEVQSAEMLLEG